MTSNFHGASTSGRCDAVIAALMMAEENEGPQSCAQWQARHPEFAKEIAEFIADRDFIKGAVGLPEAEIGTESPNGSCDSAACGPELVPFEAHREKLGVGGIFAGQYEIFAIKEGGMGRVYLANIIPLRQGDHAGKVAIKTVVDFEEWGEHERAKGRRADIETYERIVSRFHREAETWVRIGKQANVLWAFFVLSVGDKPFLVMEYAEGGDLHEWIVQKRLGPALAINFAIQFCRGMSQAIATCKVVHRDIKPANVLIATGGLLKVADFGLAKVYDETEAAQRGDADGSSALSRSGAGTAAYMAPEQFHSLAAADTRSDIYSFGAMFYEMLTSQRLFRANSDQEHYQQRSRPTPIVHEIVADLPRELSAIVSRCLAFEPSERFQTFEDLEAALGRVYEAMPGRLELRTDETAPPEGWTIEAECSSLLALGNFRKAARRAGDALHQFPNAANHWINRGVALSHLGHHEESIACLTRATELSPANALAWANLGWGLLERGDLDGGMAAALSAVRLDDSLAEGWWTRGECERKLGRISDAIASFERAVAARPHDWRPHFFLGSCLLQAGQSQHASRALREVVRLDPNHAVAWRHLAVIHGEKGRLSEARQAIDRAVANDPENSDAWALRAVILFHMEGPGHSAAACLERAALLDPQNSKVEQLLKRIRLEANK